MAAPATAMSTAAAAKLLRFNVISVPTVKNARGLPAQAVQGQKEGNHFYPG
jgi:hypothetical protein